MFTDKRVASAVWLFVSYLLKVFYSSKKYLWKSFKYIYAQVREKVYMMIPLKVKKNRWDLFPFFMANQIETSMFYFNIVSTHNSKT